MGAVDPASMPLTLTWLRGQSGSEVPEAWVPGATGTERSHLAALGSVAAHVLGGRVRGVWPASILEWLSGAVALPSDVADELEVRVKESPDEALALLYAQLVAGPRRRVLGTFFTPGDEVTPMLDRWAETQDAPTRVIDVGAGVGVFTAAAAEKWPTAQVDAVDINPVTLGLLGARMAQPDTGDAAARVTLVEADFTAWLPEQATDRTDRRLILGNPPYTRGQLIDPATRARLTDATKGLCGSRASLSAFITALALSHLGPNDGLCLLLPAQWLESQYAEPLRRRLLTSTRRRVELHLVREEWFVDATVDAVVLLVGTEREASQQFTVAEWKHAPRPIDRGRASADGWRSWFAAPSTDKSTQPVVAAATPFRLNDVATVRRGVATGANSYFLLSDETRHRLALPDAVLQRVVHRLMMFPNGVTDDAFDALPAGERSWLFSATQEQASLPGVESHLATGHKLQVPERYLCNDRATWHDLAHDIVIPDVIVTAMTKAGFRIVTNDVGAAITNNLYGLKWHPQVPAERRSAILEWLREDRGQTALRAACRRQGGGLGKLEPRSLARLELPASLRA